MKLEALTPKDDLYGNEKSFMVYKDYLDDAFENPKIRNLALSGSLGSGKSSIIRSYDRARNYGKKHFLYVSLMSFSNQNSETPTDDQKQLEYSLLNQIMSCCTSKDLPEGSINGIPEKFKWLRTCSLWLSALCLSIYMLIFHSQFGKLAAKLAEKTLFGFDLSRYLSEDIRTWVHLGLYAFVGIILFICVFCILRRCLPFFRLSKLTVKANNAEAEVLMGKERTSLDVYKFELAYALEKIGKNYDYTVVFEDLERLDPGVAVDIMEKLRELNTLTNNHIHATKVNRLVKRLRWGAYKENMHYSNDDQGKPKSDQRCVYFNKLASRKHIRFVYAVSDSTLNIEHRTKFYDCIIPIVPISNPLNGRYQLQIMLEKLQIHPEFHQPLLNELPNAIVDYRMYLTLKNEFSVLWDMYTKMNFSTPAKIGSDAYKNDKNDWDTTFETKRNKATIFAIAAYKVLLPQSYEHALSPIGNGQLSQFKSENDDELIKTYPKQDQRKKVFNAIKSLQQNPNLLDESCLRVILGENQVMLHWLSILQNTLTKAKLENSDKSLLNQVIPAVSSGFEKIKNKDLCSDYRQKMSSHLHELLGNDQEEHFLFVFKSLAAVSSVKNTTECKWLTNIPEDKIKQKVFFCRCVLFLANNHTFIDYQSPLLSTWFASYCNNWVNHDISDGETQWTDEMYKIVSTLYSHASQGSQLLSNGELKNTCIGSTTLYNICR